MDFASLAQGESVFLDANILVYHFGPHPVLGQSCNDLMKRIEASELVAYTSTHVLSETAHHLMTLEASSVFGWTSKVVQHLKQSPDKIQQLSRFRQAIEQIPQLGVQVLTIPVSLVASATVISQQCGLLSNDALLVALMQLHGISRLASLDADFDRIPGVIRHSP